MPATTDSMAQKSLYIDNPLSTSNTYCLTTFACTTELLSKPAMEKSQGNITTDCFVHHGDNTSPLTTPAFEFLKYWNLESLTNFENLSLCHNLESQTQSNMELDCEDLTLEGVKGKQGHNKIML